MKRKEKIEKISNAFERIQSLLGIDFFEVISLENDTFSSLYNKNYSEKFQPVTFGAIFSQHTITPESEKKVIHSDIAAAGKTKVYCSIYPFTSNTTAFILIFQAVQPIQEQHKEFLAFVASMFKLCEQLCDEDALQQKTTEKYKKELLNMRNMQAKLFPRFDNVRNLEIGSAFLPADLMSGNFIDAFFVGETKYQLATCEILGEHATASFVGAAIRTLLRLESHKKMVPSGIIETITEKLRKIVPEMQALILLTIYHINVATGVTQISSYGALSTLYHNQRKNGFLNLKETSIGKMLESRTFAKDISVKMEQDDTLLYYSSGINNTTDETNMHVYGERNLFKCFAYHIDESPVSITHAIIENIYEFTNYSPLKNDIIIVCVRKK
jgi:serine phosphatase RsbU (regulator of sigma subunit)